MTHFKILQGDCLQQLKTLPDKTIQCCVTSPPYYGLRSYLPDVVRLKNDAPEWVIKKLTDMGIYPLDYTTG
jgi:DNA modification methylase